MAGLNYHSPDVIPYLLAVWVFVLLDIVGRSVTTRIVRPQLQALPNAQSTLVIINTLSSGFFPGQHVRIRVPAIKLLESHPFTIASANGEGVELIVKVSGDWTAKLHQMALEGRKIRCSVEGPYGEDCHSQAVADSQAGRSTLSSRPLKRSSWLPGDLAVSVFHVVCNPQAD